MKRAWVIALILFLISGCTDNTAPKTGDDNLPPDDKNTNALVYNENGVRFEVPDVWEDNFSDAVSTNGTGENAYTTIEFTYTAGEISVPVMMISRFTAAQWQKLTAQDKNAEKGLIGKSSDGKNYYHIYFAELDYFTDKNDKEKFDSVKSEARRLKDKIAITE